MAVDGFGAAADHAGLSGLDVGDPHPQYAYTAQGLAAARPAQPVRAGVRYLATDTGVESMSDGSAWHDLAKGVHTHPYAAALTSTQEYVTRYNPPDGNTAPSSYPSGLSHGGATSGAAGWPTGFGWGIHITRREGTEVTQTLYSHFGVAVSRRYSNSATPNVWSAWVGDGAWVALTLASGVAQYGSVYYNAAMRKDMMGYVHFRGLITAQASGTLFTLPVGYRLANPNGATAQSLMHFNMRVNSATQEGGVRANGEVYGNVGAAGQWLDLCSIPAFLAEA